MKRFVLHPLRVLCLAGVWAMVLSIAWVAVLGVLDPPVTWVMAEQAREQKSFSREWRDLDRISHDMPLAVVASEDQKFMEHHGFDWEAIDKAMRYNERKKGKRVRGASTISQQVAKNVFLWSGRNWIRKGAEVWFTLLIEGLWSKERIIEVYLNVAETGPGRFGVEAAAQACFNRPASKLTRDEAAAIAVVIPSPRTYSCSDPGPKTRTRAAWVVRNMNNLGDVFDPVVRERNAEAQRKREERRARRRARQK